MFAAGALVEQLPGRKYCSSLHFYELRLKPPLPRTATLTKMGYKLPESVVGALRLPTAAVAAAAGPLRPDEGLVEARTQAIDAAARLRVKIVVVPTPATLTPGGRSRELLKRYFEAFPRIDGQHLVWAPKGAWEPETKAELCHELGLICGFDPIHEPRPPGPVVYGQLQTMGYQTSFSGSTLAEVAETIAEQPFEQAYVSIDSSQSFKQAQQLQQFADAGVE